MEIAALSLRSARQDAEQQRIPNLPEIDHLSLVAKRDPPEIRVGHDGYQALVNLADRLSCRLQQDRVARRNDPPQIEGLGKRLICRQ